VKQQFVVIHKIRKTEITTSLDTWVAKTPSDKFVTTKKLLVLMFSQKKLLAYVLVN